MGGRARKRGKTHPSSIKSVTHYYPLYVGWTSQATPLFLTPTAALCYQLSRYLRDSLCHSPDVPKWLCCVGGLAIKDTTSVYFGPSLKSSSKIENKYFSQIEVFYLTELSKRQSSLVLKIPDDTFTLCRGSLKELPDYQSSSGSIYKPNANAINLSCTTTLADREGMSLTRDGTTGLINIGYFSRAALKKTKKGSNICEFIWIFKYVHLYYQTLTPFVFCIW